MQAKVKEIPKKMTFQLRFFTFREVAMSNVSLWHPNIDSDVMEL